MLRVRNLSVFHNGIPAVKTVSMEIGDGEIVALVGPNGAGKTSLARAIAGLERYPTGSVTIEGNGVNCRLDHIPAWKIARLGIVFIPEDRHVFENLSVRENLEIAFASLGKDKRGHLQQLEKINSLFPFLWNRLDQVAGTLSGGEKRSLAIARGFLFLKVTGVPRREEPRGFRLLILDEPTHGLDPAARGRMTDILRSISKDGITILLIEQLAAFALATSSRAYVMGNGEIERFGSAAEIAENETWHDIRLGPQPFGGEHRVF
jgi:branched-chain amino acid transport system ATP-binding protein